MNMWDSQDWCFTIEVLKVSQENQTTEFRLGL
jgi:hypothetical protein